MNDRKALGRGLAALIPQKTQEQQQAPQGHNNNLDGKEIIYILTESIRPNRFQPRKSFQDETLKDLADSIREKGVLQPILVRRLGETDFELLAGERRWRAVKSLGLDKIPAIVRETHDADALEIALIENIQRDDLNPLEEARAYKRLSDEFGFNAEKISQMVGKAVSSVNNIVRLLGLSPKVQDAILSGAISAGHAKAILALKDHAEQEKLCQRIIDTGLTVRDAENISSKAKASPLASDVIKKDVEVAALEDRMQRALGTKVRVVTKKRGGRIVVEYFSNKDLERIIDLITIRSQA